MLGHADRTASVRQHYADVADHIWTRDLPAVKGADQLDHGLGSDLSYARGICKW